MQAPLPARLFVDAKEVAALLNEGLTVFHSSRGSRRHPSFPMPVCREGRKPQWLASDIAAFALLVAEESRIESRDSTRQRSLNINSSA